MTGTVPPTDSCRPGAAGGDACVRGTVGCPSGHDESGHGGDTLLERLDAAERVLVEAMALPLVPPDVQPWDDWAIVTAEWKAARCATINSASARCMAAAARAIVSVEDVPE